ncbi:AMP-dependent synthetase/ligase [Nocardioides sp. CPCC 205120]|uniref:AMP-dependent synthetase/ligase n=1 Tax=Nocardioides sp. CPCC 205120 TaxID=3406462 RepID=UPI003B503DC5
MPINHDASFIERMPRNVAVQFLDRVERSGDREAYRFPTAGDDGWDSVTWRQVGDRVNRMAAGLLSLGLGAEERVGIASATRYEWVLADLAVMCAGGATTTVYPTTNADDTAYIVADADCQVVFAEDDEQVAKLRAHRDEIPSVSKVVTFTGTTDGDWVIGLEDLAVLGDALLAETPDAVRKVADSIEPEALATLIYTSGTTGRPKGVRLQHRAWVYEGEAIRSQGILDETDLQFLWLPMAHSFGKVLLSTQLACGFATAIDGRVERIVDNLGVVKPTFMGAAPRIFEKAHGKIVTMQAAEGGAKEKIFKKAFEVGLEVERRKRDGRSVPVGLKVQHRLFDRLVFSKVRDRFGGRVRFFISGSAALNREVAEWFNAAGILVLEGYGLTETAAGAFVNHPEQNKFGTVGHVFPGGEVKIAEDGEVLVKGPNVMQGYHNLPDKTAEALDADGWLHTGDIGELDQDGFLKITDRKKDLFKTSGGKYIAPSAIESQFKALCPYASQFLVVGNNRNYVVALITLDPDQVEGWAAQNGMEGKPYAEVVRSEGMQELVAGYVEQLNARLNRWETVKRYEVLDHDLTIEAGELTPSLKVKRPVVEANNKSVIEGLYSS